MEWDAVGWYKLFTGSSSYRGIGLHPVTALLACFFTQIARNACAAHDGCHSVTNKDHIYSG